MGAMKQDERLTPMAMLLVCLCSWSLPLLTDPMLPALPVLREAFAVPMPRVQLVFSLALASFAVAQAFMGLWADRYGRRPVLLVGFALYVLGAALAGQASSFDELLVWRVVQSAGAAAGPVLARAIVRDVLPPSKAARAFSLLGSVWQRCRCLRRHCPQNCWRSMVGPARSIFSWGMAWWCGAW